MILSIDPVLEQPNQGGNFLLLSQSQLSHQPHPFTTSHPQIELARSEFGRMLNFEQELSLLAHISSIVQITF